MLKETIKKIRLAAQLQQDEFAKELGITASAINNYELGRRKPRMDIRRAMITFARINKIKFEVEDFHE